MILATLSLGLIAHQQIRGPIATLNKLRPIVLKALSNRPASIPGWLLTSSSWDSVWEEEAFGVGRLPLDASQFRFRVPPDYIDSTGGKPSPFLIEAYENGLPSYGIRRDGSCELCRPLGIEYGTDGLCRRLSVAVAHGTGWHEPKLSRRAKTALVGVFNLYQSQFFPPTDVKVPFKFGRAWIRIVSQGHGTYWLDYDLNIIGPYGIADRISASAKDVIESILRGEWNSASKTAPR